MAYAAGQFVSGVLGDRIGGVVVRTDGEFGFALRFDRRAMSELARNQLREFVDRMRPASL